MKKWLNGTIYPCRKMGKYPQIYCERVMLGKYRGIAIKCFEVKGETGITISLTNKMARSLRNKIELALQDEEE